MSINFTEWLKRLQINLKEDFYYLKQFMFKHLSKITLILLIPCLLYFLRAYIPVYVEPVVLKGTDTDLSGKVPLDIAQRIYELSNIILGIVGIIITGIAVTTPIIIMSWSQVLDSTFALILKP